MDHPSQQELIRFANGNASEKDAGRVFGHIAHCENCAARIETLRNLAANFDAEWSNLEGVLKKAATLSAAEVQDSPATQDTLEADAESASPLRPPLARARRKFDLAVGVLIDSVQHTASIGAEGISRWMRLPSLFQMQFRFQYHGVGDPKEMDKVQGLAEKAATSCAQDDPEDARLSLTAASRIAPRSVETAELKVSTGGRARCRIVVNSRRRAISVLAYPSEADQASTVGWHATLVSEEGDILDRQPFQPVEGADYLLAEFENVSDGFHALGLAFGCEATTES